MEIALTMVVVKIIDIIKMISKSANGVMAVLIAQISHAQIHVLDMVFAFKTNVFVSTIGLRLIVELQDVLWTSFCLKICSIIISTPIRRIAYVR